MIDFRQIAFSEKEAYQTLTASDRPRGCEYSFNNLFLWGDQKLAFLHGCAAVFSSFGGFRLYPYPAGSGDRKAVIEAFLEDAKERGIPCRLSGMTEEDRQELEAMFPGKFVFRPYRNGYDYVYDIDQLADLPGRKMQKKRNHVNKFLTMHPDWHVEPVTEAKLPQIREMADQWYADREADKPDGEYDMEKTALERAFSHFREMDMEGLVLTDGGEILAFTMGSRMREDTFDTHFEKAKESVEGAYSIINREFARHLREKHPEIRYIDREDDMGLEGLRKAKLSYNPHHLIEKGMACLAEEGFPEEEENAD